MVERVPAGRKQSEIRPIIVEIGPNRYAEGSVIIRAGNTHVLCTASIDESVPPWLKGKGQGWITAEYSMLPRATHTRSKRERDKVGGRTQEIQRLIARALRSTIDLKKLGERQIIVDCDVLQADGGTRTASITGGCIALAMALSRAAPEAWAGGAWIDTVSAISVGLRGGELFTDLDYNEDSSCDVDMNFVVTGKGLFVEVQGTAEKAAFTKAQLDQMTAAAQDATSKIREIQLQTLKAAGVKI